MPHLLLWAVFRTETGICQSTRLQILSSIGSDCGVHVIRFGGNFVDREAVVVVADPSEGNRRDRDQGGDRAPARLGLGASWQRCAARPAQTAA